VKHWILDAWLLGYINGQGWLQEVQSGHLQNMLIRRRVNSVAVSKEYVYSICEPSKNFNEILIIARIY